MRILVTGSKGQLGNEIQVLAEDYPDYDFIYTDVDELDITDQFKVEAFFVEHKPQVIPDIIPSAIQHPGTELFHYSNKEVASWFNFAKIIIAFSNINYNINPIQTMDNSLPAPKPAL